MITSFKELKNQILEFNPENSGIYTGKNLEEAELLSFRDLINQQINIESSVDDSVYVPVLISGKIDFIKAVFCLWNAGKVPVAIDPKTTYNELEVIKNMIPFQFSLTDSNINNTQFSSPEETDNYSEERAIVILTSGSTGKPKAVLHTFRTLSEAFNSGKKFFNYSNQDRWLLTLPLFHISGFSIFFRVLLSGSKLIIPDSNLERTGELVEKFSITHLSLVNTQLQEFAKTESNFSSLKAVLCGGTPFNSKLIQSCIDKNIPVYKVYGSSETAAFVTALDCKNFRSKNDSAGLPLNGVDIIIDNQNDEVLIKSKSLFVSYLGNENITGKNQEGYFRTGDCGFIDSAGFLFLTGRVKDLIITGGKKVSSIEVENALCELAFITDCHVFGIENEKWGEAVAAAIVGSEHFDEDDLDAYLRNKLSAYKIPKKFFFVEFIPKSSTGKTDIVALKNLIGIE
ncbi:MAG: AMP-binding protein [Ignavibacteriaceae bacterium]|nr:AMP-binding protein [Ignavibacteriaceae bacterium]